MSAYNFPYWAGVLKYLKSSIVAGAGANTNIAVAGIKASDFIISAENLTDLTDINAAAASAFNAAALTSQFDTVVQATATGVGGNQISVKLIGDSASGVVITVNAQAKKVEIHFQTGVSTITNVETAIAALAGQNDIIGTKTPGTGATVLTAALSTMTDFVPLTGGVTAGPELPVCTSAGNVQFPTQTTATKKVRISWMSAPA